MEQEIRALELPEWEILPDIGLYMDQVVTLMDRTFSPTLPKGEMTKSMVNNYVKVGMIPRPAGKKYDRDHLAMLIMIGVLKQALSMESISRLLEVICRDGSVHDLLLHVKGLTEDEKEIILDGCLMNYYAKRMAAEK